MVRRGLEPQEKTLRGGTLVTKKKGDCSRPYELFDEPLCKILHRAGVMEGL